MWNSCWANWAIGRSVVSSQLDLEYKNLLQRTFLSRKKDALERNNVFSGKTGDPSECATIDRIDCGKCNYTTVKSVTSLTYSPQN